MESNINSQNSGKSLRVHIDTEFTDFVNTDLISIGAACENGDTFYGENLQYIKSWQSDFVKENIVPLLNPTKYGMSTIELSSRLWVWIDELPCDQVIITYDYKTDWVLLDRLFSEEKHPKIIDEHLYNNIYYDCDQICKDMGSDNNAYDRMVEKVKTKFETSLIEYFHRTKEIPHHALSDAKANCEAYLKIVNKFGIRR